MNKIQLRKVHLTLMLPIHDQLCLISLRSNFFYRIVVLKIKAKQDKPFYGVTPYGQAADTMALQKAGPLVGLWAAALH